MKNLNTAQYFLKDGPLAILPFSKNTFSFVKKYFGPTIFISGDDLRNIFDLKQYDYSKGVKNKNIKKIKGKPLIYYTLNQAKKSKLFSSIVVSKMKMF